MTEREVLEKYYDQILNILNTVKVGIFITDKNGKVLMLNKESERTGGLKTEEVIGRNMKDLMDEGYVDESSALMTIKEKKEVRLITNLGDGQQLYITSTPYYRDNDLELVVCTERDITETIRLQKLLEQSEEIAENHKRELHYLQKKVIGMDPHIIAESYAMKQVMNAAIRVARRNTTVLISGESGTGKEIIANYIFQNSTRTEKPFIKVNCAAMPENLLESELFGYEKGAFTGANQKGKAGIFELAQEGTLFLDEIAEIPFHLQAKLLRVLQEKEIMRIGGKSPIPVDVRIIAASNVDLKKAVEDGNFREDLYYRLNIMPIEIPPLRERKEDIVALAEHFIEIFCNDYEVKKSISPEGMEVLKRYSWPGNIRELRNLIERIVISFDGEKITARQVKNMMLSPVGKKINKKDEKLSLEQLMAEYERELLVSYLEEYSSAAEVARKLQVNKSTISRKLKKHNLVQE